MAFNAVRIFTKVVGEFYFDCEKVKQADLMKGRLLSSDNKRIFVCSSLYTAFCSECVCTIASLL